MLDGNFRVTLWNREAERITHLSATEMMGQAIGEKLPGLVEAETYRSFQKAFKKKMTVTLEQYNDRSDRWLEMSSLQTPDENGVCVRHLLAPGLPAIYAHAIDGLPIGPEAGSCGAAMHRKEKVIVSDIGTDPLWSFPILTKSPTSLELDMVERAANLVTTIIAQAIVDAQEKERAGIGKELHDNINQILSTTKLYLELAKNNVSRSLVPAGIGDLGLLDSISDLVESVRITRAVHVEFYPVGKFDEKISDKEKLNAN